MSARSSRVVWITGASSGIGSALAQIFALQGDGVYATARSRARLRLLERRVKKQGGRLTTAVCDVRKQDSVRDAAKRILQAAGKIDILINNAGVTYFKDLLSTTPKEFEEVVETNLVGLFLTTRSVLPSMMKRRKGLIINVLSFAAKRIYTLSAAYSASKAGGDAMMNVLREEVRKHGIKVMNVYPGAILTPMWHAKHRARYGHQMLRPQEAAEVIYEASLHSNNVMIEELVVRPQTGDLKV